MSIKKRCACHEKDWDLCGHAWHYDVSFATIKHRGPIPGAVTRADARAASALIAGRLRNGLPPFEAASTNGLTVAQLGEEWLSLPRGRKASTIDGYRDHLRAHLTPVLGHTAVMALTPDRCEAFLLAVTRRRGDAPLSLKTKKSIARTLHALFEFAVEKRKLATNPADHLLKAIENPDISPDDGVVDPQDHTKYFTADEAQHLLTTCREKFPDWYAFVLTGLQTGMRLGELRLLSYEQVNWRGAYITVDRAWVRGRRTSPKNGKTRTVSLSRDLRSVLYLRWRRHRTSDLLFPSRVGTPLETSRLQRFWRQLLDTSELGYRTRHAMRHTHDSLMIQAGVPPAKVAAESGRDLQETMKTYAHFMPGGNRDDAERLAGLLGGSDTRVRQPVTTGLQRPRSMRAQLRRVV